MFYGLNSLLKKVLPNPVAIAMIPEEYPLFLAISMAFKASRWGSDGDIFSHSFKLMKLGKTRDK